MDWIRRNWPDLLIGLALVAVIAGIIATLLTGGSFFPLGQSNRSDVNGRDFVEERQRDPVNLPVEPIANSTAVDTAPVTTEDGRTAPETPGVTPGNGVQVSPLPIPGAGAGNQQSQPTSAGDRADQGQPQVAGEPAARENETPETSSGQDAGSAAAVVGAAAAAPATTRSVPPGSSAGADEEGSYRISVGAFGARENAERQAETFRSAGFPVFIGTQGDLSIVLVGPYRDLNEAESVADSIRRGDFDIEPVIYRYQPDASDGAAAATAAAETTPGSRDVSPGNRASVTTTADAAPPSSAVTTSSSAASQPSEDARYLQVGAYATAESARPQRERLEALGFRVSDVTEGGLIKLLVGPFSGEDLASARSRLEAQGIEHFPR